VAQPVDLPTAVEIVEQRLKSLRLRSTAWGGSMVRKKVTRNCGNDISAALSELRRATRLPPRTISKEIEMPPTKKSAAAAKKAPAPVKSAAAKRVAPAAKKATATAKKAIPATVAPQATITLKHIAAQLAEGHDLPKKRAEALLGDLVTVATEHLTKGDKIRLTGLGILQVRSRPARMGRNPATGASIKIAASKKIAFRPAKELKEAV
jgi:DNA-binding protein HU-beta